MTNQRQPNDESSLTESPRLRILFAPHEVCGQMQLLAEGFRAHGHEATAVAYETDPYGIKNDSCLKFEDKSKPGKIAASLAFTTRALRDYDVFHFFYGRSLLPKHLDLPLLKRAGKKIFVHFRGSDIRNRKWVNQVKTPTLLGQQPATDIPRSTAQQIKRLDTWRRYANNIFISTPDLLDVAPEAQIVQQAIDLKQWPYEPQHHSGDKTELVIGHTPTNRHIKGSEYLIAAVQQLQDRGHAVRLHLMENAKSSEVMQHYQQSDIVVDQLILGVYGNVSIESLALGKPVITNLGSWYREHRPDLPVVHADPSDIAEKLEALITDPARRKRLGAAGREYVKRWHDVNIHVARLLDFYTQK